jgi:hypothetical protein
LVIAFDGRVEGLFQISNASLGIGNANGAHPVYCAADAYARLFGFVAAFFGHALFAMLIDFFVASLIRDEFCT